MSRTNRVFAGAGHGARRPVLRGAITHGRQVLLVLLGVLLLLLLCERAALFTQGDSHLRYVYYRLEPAANSRDPVVFVSIDEHTAQSWGPPPWRWRRYESMLESILAENPRVVGLLEPGPRVVAEQVPYVLTPALQRGLEQKRLVLPSPNPGLGQPELGVGPYRGVEFVSLHSGSSEHAVTADIIAAAGLPVPTEERLWVRYLGGMHSLPTVPAHRISSGEIPGQTFRDRIVIVGLRGERFAPQVATPIGAMSPAEVHAYAMRGLANDAVWAPMPPWATWLLRLGLVLVCLVTLPRLGVRGAMTFLGSLCIGIVLLDYLLFTGGIVRLGGSGLMGAVGLAAFFSWLTERYNVQRELIELTAWASRRLELADVDGEEDALNALWLRFSRASRAFIRCDSALLGELPEGRWHLRFTLALHTEPEMIDEMRRDIGREPYKSAFMSHQAVWSDRFMKRELEQKTLLVPLSSFNRILGIWVLNFPCDQEVSSSTMEVIDTFARQLTLTLERRRIRRLLAVRTSRREGFLLQPIQKARSTMQYFSHEQRSLAQMFNSLPVGVLVATLWGQVEYVNTAMRRFLATFDVDGPENADLLDLLTVLTEQDEDATHDTVLALIEGGKASVDIHCQSNSEGREHYRITLSTLSASVLMDEGAGGNNSGLAHLVLTVSRRSEGEIRLEEALAAEHRAGIDSKYVTQIATERGARFRARLGSELAEAIGTGAYDKPADELSAESIWARSQRRRTNTIEPLHQHRDEGTQDPDGDSINSELDEALAEVKYDTA